MNSSLNLANLALELAERLEVCAMAGCEIRMPAIKISGNENLGKLGAKIILDHVIGTLDFSPQNISADVVHLKEFFTTEAQRFLCDFAVKIVARKGVGINRSIECDVI